MPRKSQSEAVPQADWRSLTEIPTGPDLIRCTLYEVNREGAWYHEVWGTTATGQRVQGRPIGPYSRDDNKKQVLITKYYLALEGWTGPPEGSTDDETDPAETDR